MIHRGNDMYLLNYDFCDLHYIFVLIRSDPETISMAAALEEIAAYIARPDDTNGIAENTVRRLLQKHYGRNDKRFQWVYVENYYTAYTAVVKEQAYYAILSAVLSELFAALRENAERARLAADAVHNIPLLLFDSKNPRKAIERGIREYRETCHRDFLQKELSLLKRNPYRRNDKIF